MTCLVYAYDDSYNPYIHKSFAKLTFVDAFAILAKSIKIVFDELL